MFNYSNLWTFPAYHMDVCKEKYYGNTYRWPEHFREPKKLEDPSSPGHSSYVCFILFQRGSGYGGDAQLLAKFSPISQLSANFLAISRLTVNFNKSLLIFVLNFIFLHLPFKKSQTHTSISIRRSEAFAVTSLFLRTSEQSRHHKCQNCFM